VSPPADGGEPGARAGDRCRCEWCLEELSPPVEVHGRRAGIQTVFSPTVLPNIHQHVHECMPHLPRRGERARVISILPNGTASTECAVDRPSHPDREAAETALECVRVVGLDD